MLHLSVIIEAFLALETALALVAWELLLGRTAASLIVLGRVDNFLGVLRRLAVVAQLLPTLVDCLADLALEDRGGRLRALWCLLLRITLLLLRGSRTILVPSLSVVRLCLLSLWLLSCGRRRLLLATLILGAASRADAVPCGVDVSLEGLVVTEDFFADFTGTLLCVTRSPLMSQKRLLAIFEFFPATVACGHGHT